MSEYNEDELHAPKWMAEEFFRKVLVQCENDKSVKITKLTITPGSAKGDHYGSVMFRIAVIYDTVNSKGILKSMIIKMMPEVEGNKKEMLGESYIFETEISMYLNTIPAFEAELRKIGDDTVLGAKMLYHSLGERKLIIFEDIVPKGYATLKDGVANITEVKAALLKLAKWHAVSYKLAAEGDQSVTRYREGFLNMKNVEEMPFIATGFDNFMKIVQKQEELKKYTPKLQALKKDLLHNCKNSFNSYRIGNNPEGVYVLCHGDFHAKNFMFKRNEKGEHEDIMLLDFQLCYFGPAVLDIIYAIYMVFDEDMRINRSEELIYYYSSNFIDTLKRLQFKGEYPKIADFHMDILRHRHWTLLLFSSFLPLWYGFRDGIIDPELLLTSNEVRFKLYENKGYIDEIKRVLPILCHRGYLD